MLISMNWISDFVDLTGLDKMALIRQFSLSTAEVENEIFGFPSLPRLVVIKITPFAPRIPNTAVAEASFNTVTLSISFGSMSVMLRSTPST